MKCPSLSIFFYPGHSISDHSIGWWTVTWRIRQIELIFPSTLSGSENITGYPWPKEKAFDWPKNSPPCFYLWPYRWWPLANEWSCPAIHLSPTNGLKSSVHVNGEESLIPAKSYRVLRMRVEERSLRTLRRTLDGPEPCIEIESATREEDSYSQVFDLWVWGSWKLCLPQVTQIAPPCRFVLHWF